MMNTGYNSVVSRVEDLRHYSTDRIYSVQDSKVPMFGNLELYPKFAYRYDGVDYRIRDMKYQCYLAKNLPFIHKANESKLLYMDSMINCITKKLIYPFILFIQDKFIPWSNIIVVKDYFYSYLLIYGFDDFNVFDDYSVIYLPCYVKYGENSLLYKANDNPAFYFNEDGLLTLSTDNLKGRVEIIDKNVTGKDFYISEEKPYFTVETESVPIDVKSILLFKDGKPFKEGLDRIINKGANVFEFTKYDTDEFDLSSILIRVYYFNKSNKSKSNVYNSAINLSEVRKDIVSGIVDGSELAYLDYIRNEFNFDHIRKLSYDKNLANSIRYILGYNPLLLNKAYTDLSRIKNVTYTGAEIISMMNENKKLTMFRRNKDTNTDTFVIVFRNNRLFENYNTIEYDTNKFTLLIGDDVDENDSFEFLFFNYVNNESADIVVNEGQLNYTSPMFDLKYCELYSKEVEGPYYNLYSEKDHIQYRVNYSYTEENKYENKITLSDKWYYGRTMSLVSTRQFRYCWNNITSDRLTITLSPDFKYCHNLDHYMVFINGHKLDKDQIERQSTMHPDLPFDELCLYTNVIMKKGDIVEVFYIPEIFTEVEIVNENIAVDNTIEVTFKNDFYNFSKELQYIFINGLKIHPNYIHDIKHNKIVINSVMEEIQSVSVLQYLDPIDIITDTILTNEDLWTSMIESLTEEEYNRIINKLPEINTDYYSRNYMVPTEAVIHEMIHNFYNVEGVIDPETNEFMYGYTTEVIDTHDYDESGNYIIRSSDTSKEDKAAIYNTTENEWDKDDEVAYNKNEEEEENYG